MSLSRTLPSGIDRRRFLSQSFAFSALAALGSKKGWAAPLQSPAGAAELMMIGDWGFDSHHDGQTAVAAGMREYAKKLGLHPQALLMLGDNWYGDLAGGAKSDRWKTHFEDLYPADTFACPVYAILGNHDYQQLPADVVKVDAELEYARTGRTAAGPTRWTMPSLWYTFQFPAEKPLITFIALDSNMPPMDGHKVKLPDFTLSPQQQAEQLAWLEMELQKPRKTPYLIVMGHHPIYTDGPHGDHPVLVRDWDPLFRKYKVDVYLAGHDHDLQHLEFDGHPTSHFLSGGGGADLYNLKTDPSQRGPFAQKVYGFSHVSATRQMLTLRHVDSTGRTLHAFTKTPDGMITIITE